MLRPDQCAVETMHALLLLCQGVDGVPAVRRRQGGEEQSFLLGSSESTADGGHGIFLARRFRNLRQLVARGTPPFAKAQGIPRSKRCPASFCRPSGVARN